MVGVHNTTRASHYKEDVEFTHSSRVVSNNKLLECYLIFDLAYVQ